MKNAVVVALISGIILAVAGSALHNPGSRRIDQMPRLVLWSWEHNDNFRFLNPGMAAVAYYEGTIVLGRGIATLRKRKNPLVLKDAVDRFPVFRIENAHPKEAPSALSLTSAVQTIADYVATHHCRVVQIDYDAAQGDRKQYIWYLEQLRHRLPAKTAISITALSSWCLGDKWLQNAPVDETVAMMFTMGARRGEVISALSRGLPDSGAECVQSLGVSINEPDTNRQLSKLGTIKQAKHVYAFSALGWTKRTYDQLAAEVDTH